MNRRRFLGAVVAAMAAPAVPRLGAERHDVTAMEMEIATLLRELAATMRLMWTPLASLPHAGDVVGPATVACERAAAEVELMLPVLGSLVVATARCAALSCQMATMAIPPPKAAFHQGGVLREGEMVIPVRRYDTVLSPRAVRALGRDPMPAPPCRASKRVEPIVFRMTDRWRKR